MPSVFNVIDSSMKCRLNEVPINQFVSGAPISRVFRHDGRVSSQIYWSKSGIGVTVKGIYDTVLELEDGSFALVDLKTIKPSPKLATTYSMQLHAYAWAVENPAIDENRLFPVSRLALIAFAPERFTSRSDGSSALVGRNTWVEVEGNYEQFFAFLDFVAELLASDTCPPAGKFCPTCNYMNRLREFEGEGARFKMAV